MQLSGSNTEKKQKGLMYWLCCLSVFIYIISAVSCEMSQDTAFISTYAIYLVFFVGFFFLIQKNNVYINEYFVLSIMFCLYVLMRCVASNASLTMGFQIAYWEITCVVLCLLVYLMASKYPELVNYAMAAYIVGAIILSVRIVNEYGGINEMIELASSEGETRIGGLFGNENGIGLFLANGILCCVVFLIKKKKSIISFITIVSIFLLGTMLLFTGSRKSLVFALSGVLFIVYLNYRKSKVGKKIFVFILMVLIVFMLYNAISTLPMFSTINQRFELLFEGIAGEDNSYETDRVRKMMITEGLNAFYQKPLFGHGTGYSYKLFRTYSHNNFVELLMNYGIVGFVLYYSIYICLAVKLVSHLKTNDIIVVYFLVYICVQVFLGVGWVNYYERPVQLVTSLAFGYLVSLKK